MTYFTQNVQLEYTWENMGKSILDLFTYEKLTQRLEKELSKDKDACFDLNQSGTKFRIINTINLKEIKK